MGRPYGLEYVYYLLKSAEVESAITNVKMVRLRNPLNYARIRMDEYLPQCMTRVIYVDCDAVFVSPIEELWHTKMNGKAVAASEFCQFKFKGYFNANFWGNATLAQAHKHRVGAYASGPPNYSKFKSKANNFKISKRQKTQIEHVHTGEGYR